MVSKVDGKTSGKLLADMHAAMNPVPPGMRRVQMARVAVLIPVQDPRIGAFLESVGLKPYAQEIVVHCEEPPEGNPFRDLTPEKRAAMTLTNQANGLTVEGVRYESGGFRDVPVADPAAGQ